MRPPETRRGDLVETLHGHQIADPYRWLEDADAPEVAAWVAEQRDYADGVLASLPGRAWFAGVMDRIVTRPRAGIPYARGGRFFLSRNDGTTDQDVWYVADSLAEVARGGEVVLDPNAWSDDRTASLNTFSVARDGSLLAYAISDGGSDWQRFRVRDLTTGDDLPDVVVGKFGTPAWLPDHRSFLYTTFDQAADARGTATAGLRGGRLMIHRVGGADEEVLRFGDEPMTLASGRVSHDGAWLVVTIVRGTENTNRLWAYPLVTTAGRTELGEPVKIVDTPDAAYRFVRVDGADLYLTTDLAAPLGRVVRVDLEWAARGDVEFAEVVPEARATLLAAEAAGDGLLLAYLDDAQRVVVWSRLDGSSAAELDLPTGALVALDGSPDRDTAFVGLATPDAPTAAYAVEPPTAPDAACRVTPLELTGPAASIAPAHTVSRPRARSADGTAVPYFLLVPDDGRDGPRPTLLYGYGGFKIPVTADYRPGWPAWLAAGGALAIANLRGGGEYGTAWYDAGRGRHKQNVFDDAIAVAEHLIATGVTTAGQLAVHGRSNGGLLVGALLTQRPELFAAALPAVGVLDLLRFHRFTGGAAWTSDYGDPEIAEDFATALAYSPLHRVTPGVAYPATLIVTADHDDRVVPLHSYKFGAALQAAQAGPAPVVLRIDRSAGHGHGMAQRALAAQWADVLAFAAHHTGLEVPSAPNAACRRGPDRWGE